MIMKANAWSLLIARVCALVIASFLGLPLTLTALSADAQAQTSAPRTTSLAVDFPTQPVEMIRAYKYLEARSHDFLQEFDELLQSNSDAVLESQAYANLLATRMLREEVSHRLADSMLQAATAVRENSAAGTGNAGAANNTGGNAATNRAANRQARRFEADIFFALAQDYISTLPLVDDLGKALSQKDLEGDSEAAKAVHADLLKRVEKIYSSQKRATLAAAWGSGEVVREMRAQAKLAPVSRLMEEAIRRYGRATYEASQKTSAVEKPSTSRSVAAAVYAPSTGANGNLTGREFPLKMWALTYDDGPAKPTTEILDALTKRGFKATFFWLSKNAPSYATSSIARAKREGNGLANHSATHAQLTKVSASQLDREILDSTKTLEGIYGQKLEFFRLPYGAGRNDSAIRQRIEAAGLIHVYWNVDTLDWQDRNPTTVYLRTMKQVNQQGRGVILFHDIHTQTVTASARVMDDLKAQGVRVVTMKEAVNVLNGVTP